MCIAYMGNAIGLATADITPGEFMTAELSSERELMDEINKFTPSEIICNEAFGISGISIDEIKNRLSVSVSELEPWYFDDNKAAEIIK